MKFEYKVEYFDIKNSKDDREAFAKTLNSVMNRLASDGWEYFNNISSASSGIFYIIFRRVRT